jgi:hypothetical protein
MNTRFLTGRPLPLQVPTAVVRIRPTSTTGVRGCGESKTFSSGFGSRRSCAHSRRFPRQ